jgi:hypothetical protein
MAQSLPVKIAAQLASLATAAMLLPLQNARAQAGGPVRLTESVCVRCLVVERAFDIAGSAPNTRPPGTAVASTRTASGELLVVYGEDPHQISRHGPDGLLRGLIGRKGRGPNEFGSIVTLRPGPNGTTVVFDEGNRQIVWLSADLLETRRVAMPLVLFDAVVTETGAVVLSGTLNTRDGLGFPLHLLDSNGQVARSFGAADPVHRPDLRTTLARLVARSSKGGIWAAHRNQYVLEKWTNEGRLEQSYKRDVAWFKPWMRAEAGVLVPLVVDVAERPDGLLTVLLRVPGDSAQSRSSDRRSRLYDSVIEIIDLARRRVIARASVDAVLTKLLDHDHATQPYTLADLESRAAVWRITYTPQ